MSYSAVYFKMNEVIFSLFVSVVFLSNAIGSMTEKNSSPVNSYQNRFLLKNNTNIMKSFKVNNDYSKLYKTNVTNINAHEDTAWDGKGKNISKSDTSVKGNHYEPKEVIVTKELNFRHLDEISDGSKIINVTGNGMEKNKAAFRDKPAAGVSSSITDYIWSVIFSFVRCFKEKSTMNCLKEKAALVLQDLKATYNAYREDQNQYDMYDEYNGNGVMGADEAFTPRAKFKKEVKYIMKALKYVSKTVLMVTPFLFFMKLKTMVLVSFSIAVLVLMSGKALLMSLVSFTLSVLAFLRNVDGSQHKVEELNLYPFKTQRRQGMEYLDGGRKNNEALFM